MSNNGAALPSRHTTHAREPVGAAEASFVMGLSVVLVAILVPLHELVLVYVPQLALLALLAGVLSALGARMQSTRARALTATALALVTGAFGLVMMRLSGFEPLALEWLLAIPFAVGAGLSCGTWVAQRGSTFPRLLLRAYEGITTAVVLYGSIGMLLVLVRS